ncbi:unnamed protein product [Ectocarpus sp. 13 AM-2016]
MGPHSLPPACTTQTGRQKSPRLIVGVSHENRWDFPAHDAAISLPCQRSLSLPRSIAYPYHSLPAGVPLRQQRLSGSPSWRERPIAKTAMAVVLLVQSPHHTPPPPLPARCSCRPPEGQQMMPPPRHPHPSKMIAVA